MVAIHQFNCLTSMCMCATIQFRNEQCQKKHELPRSYQPANKKKIKNKPNHDSFTSNEFLLFFGFFQIEHPFTEYKYKYKWDCPFTKIVAIKLFCSINCNRFKLFQLKIIWLNRIDWNFNVQNSQTCLPVFLCHEWLTHTECTGIVTNLALAMHVIQIIIWIQWKIQ